MTAIARYVRKQETSTHFFFNCPIAKAIWYGCCEGFIANMLHSSYCGDILKAILEYPPQAILQMALTLESIGTLEIK